jgi:hypothetical protein
MGIKRVVKAVEDKVSAAKAKFLEELEIEHAKMHTRVHQVSAIHQGGVIDRERARIESWAKQRAIELGLAEDPLTQAEDGDNNTDIGSSSANEVPATPSADKPGSATTANEPDKKDGGGQDAPKEPVGEPKVAKDVDTTGGELGLTGLVEDGKKEQSK